MLGHRVLVTGGSGFIGTHLLEMFIRFGASVLSIDVIPPKLSHHHEYWVSCNILSIESLNAIFTQFNPTHVYHLAAKANLKARSIEDFPENTIGTDNVVKCVNDSRSIECFIHFSTQYVVCPGVWPANDEFLLPYTPYGESKAEAEKIVRNNCDKCWIILRPTNVWGPFHPSFPYELWKYLRQRFYFHPGYKPIIKHYSFVDNAVDQVVAITLENTESVCGRVFYITDPPIDNAEWMNAFSVALSGRRVRRIPIRLWRLFARTGDALNRAGVKSPMSSERFFRLTINEQVPYLDTIELTGLPRVSVEKGVRKSIRWYMSFLAGDPTGTWVL
jgi:nucleoside-diphosphate-sugar epimerase